MTVSPLARVNWRACEDEEAGHRAVDENHRRGVPHKRHGRAGVPGVALEAVENERRPELLHRAAAHFGEAHPQHHLVRRHALLLLQQVDDVLGLVHVAAGHARGLLDDVLARDGAGDDDVLAAADDGDGLAGEQLAELLAECAQVAAHLHFVGGDRAAAVPHEERDGARGLAVYQQLAGRRDHRVGDVGHGQRDTGDGRAHVDHSRSPHEEVDVGGDRGDRACGAGGRCRGRAELRLRLLCLGGRHEDHDDEGGQCRLENCCPRSHDISLNTVVRVTSYQLVR